MTWIHPHKRNKRAGKPSGRRWLVGEIWMGSRDIIAAANSTQAAFNKYILRGSVGPAEFIKDQREKRGQE